jgi:hypothetical protein
MIDSVEHPVAIFMVNQEHSTRTMPPGFLVQVGSLHRVGHPRTAITVLINPEPSHLVRSLFSVADRAFHENAGLYVMARTLEDARRIASEVFTTAGIAPAE